MDPEWPPIGCPQLCYRIISLSFLQILLHGFASLSVPGSAGAPMRESLLPTVVVTAGELQMGFLNVCWFPPWDSAAMTQMPGHSGV